VARVLSDRNLDEGLVSYKYPLTLETNMISLFEFRDASEQYGKHEEQEDPGENHVATADGAQPKDNREDGPTQ